MLGAIVYRLRALNSATLPLINGRLMHAAFFKLLHEHAPKLEQSMHERTGLKPFTVSMLDPINEVQVDQYCLSVKRFDEFYWRLTSLDVDLIREIMTMPSGQPIRAGDLILSLEEVIAKGRRDCRVISRADFIGRIKANTPTTEMTFHFVSPTTFRIDDRDAPYPKPELIFASLADKWTQADMPALIDKQLIKEMASSAVLTMWSGQSRSIYFGKDRGTLAFWGEFRFNIERMEPTVRRVFELLARFAEYSGTGRLAAQGFGQTRMSFKKTNTL